MFEFPKYSFNLNYFDERAELFRQYILTFYTERSEIEVFDVKNNRVFLRKTELHSLSLADLFPTAKFYLNGRQYQITDYGNEFTRDQLSDAVEHTYGMIKPGFHNFLGFAIDRILANRLTIRNLRFGSLSSDAAKKFYAEHQAKPFYKELVDYISSGPVVAIEIVGPGAIAKWRKIIGPTNLEVAKREAPTSLRALYAKSTTENFAHGSDSKTSAARELAIVFSPGGLSLNFSTHSCTLLIIKPHILNAGYAGKILAEIVSNGFQIYGAILVTLDLSEAEEFYEPYRGLIDEYSALLDEMSSGPCLAVQLRAQNAVNKLREVVGPRDAKVAKIIRPDSIRAKYGTDAVKNVVHCTDLPEDAECECEYFFNLLQLTA